MFAYFDGRWDDAIALYRRARVRGERSGRPADVAFVDCNVGEILSDQGQLDAAEEHLQRARRVWSATRERPIGRVRRHAARAARGAARRSRRGPSDDRGRDGHAAPLQHERVRRFRAGAGRRGRGVRRRRAARARDRDRGHAVGRSEPSAAPARRGNRARPPRAARCRPRRVGRGAGAQPGRDGPATTSRRRSTRSTRSVARMPMPAASGTRSSTRSRSFACLASRRSSVGSRRRPCGSWAGLRLAAARRIARLA